MIWELYSLLMSSSEELLHLMVINSSEASEILHFSSVLSSCVDAGREQGDIVTPGENFLCKYCRI